MTWGDYLSYKARAEAAEAERDALREERDFLQRELGFKNTQRQEIKALREALETIVRWSDEAESGWFPGDIARKALERPE